MKLILDDRTERFLGWWAEARACSDERQAWDRWKEMYQLLPFGSTPEGEAEAFAMFRVAYPQYERMLPRIMKRGHISTKMLRSALEQVADMTRAESGINVYVTMGPAFMNPCQYAFAREGKAYLFFPTDYPYRYPQAVLAQLLTTAIHHAKLGFDTPLLATDLYVQAMTLGLSVHVSNALYPNIAMHEHLQGGADWYAQCQAYEEELIGDFLLAGERPPDAGIFRALFWPSDFMPLERPGLYVAAELVGEAIRSKGLQYVVEAVPESWRTVINEAGRTRLDWLRNQQGVVNA